MKTDAAFEELRADTGSPTWVRIPFGLFGIVINLAFFVWGWEDWPPVRLIPVLATAVPGWLMAMIALLRFPAKHGMFFGWKRPVLYNRWAWWLLIWPTPDEPKWRKTFASVVVGSAIIFFTLGGIRWGFFLVPPS